jgi:CRP-like cAMP-binding protein
LVAELESDSLKSKVAAGTELVAAGPVRPGIYFIVSGRIDVATTAAAAAV